MNYETAKKVLFDADEKRKTSALKAVSDIEHKYGVRLVPRIIITGDNIQAGLFIRLVEPWSGPEETDAAGES